MSNNVVSLRVVQGSPNSPNISVTTSGRHWLSDLPKVSHNL